MNDKTKFSEARVYVESEVQKLAKQFALSTVRYRYDDAEDIHWIDLEGPDVNTLNATEWASIRVSLVNAFEDTFETGAIILVREGSLVRVNAEEADIELGNTQHNILTAFENHYTIKWEEIIDVVDMQRKLLQHFLKTSIKKKNIWEYTSPKRFEFDENKESVLANAGTDSFYEMTY